MKMRHLKRRYNIEDIVDSYINAALWAEELDDRFDIRDVVSEDRKKIKEEIEWFVDKLNKIGNTINRMTDDQLGHDLWLTRNGHGAGFFDRGYPEQDVETLTDLCDVLGSANLYDDLDDMTHRKVELYYESSNKYKDWDFEEYLKLKKLKDDVRKYNL